MKLILSCIGILLCVINQADDLIPIKSICGGFDNCAAYNNGCNDCQCGGELGNVICTFRFCPPDEPLPKARCIRCEEGYELDVFSKCIKSSDNNPPVSCAFIDCQDGDNCYDTSNGPICCNPNEGTDCREGPMCGGIAAIKCKPGYECVNDPNVPCTLGKDPDCSGVCLWVEDNTSCPLNQPQLGDSCTFEGICYWGKETCCGQTFDSFGCRCYDGKTSCFYTDACLSPNCGTEEPISCPQDTFDCGNGVMVGRDPLDNCNFRPCPVSKPCGGFENCEAYNDGCNDCRCGLNGLDACTKKGCPPPELIPKPKCIRCKDGYQINKYGKCIKSKPQIICGGLENCEAYNNGCNDCQCGLNGLDACTKKACPPELLRKPECIRCKDGYHINKYGKCVKSKPQIICAGFENCEAYNDGCNDCQCGLNGLDACTKKACPPGVLRKSECIRCKDGYVLNKYGKCIINTKPKIPSCGGIPYCQSFKKDICNKCGCGDPINNPDMAFCTLMACAALPQPECTNCIDGYVLNDITKKCDKDSSNNKCCDPKDNPAFPSDGGLGCWEGTACCPDGSWSCSIGDGKTYTCGGKTWIIGRDIFGEVCDSGSNGKVRCKSKKDCDVENGYQCRPNPECLGNDKPMLSCMDKKVCLNVDGMCAFDGDCGVDHECVMINDKTGFCVKYQ